MKRHSMLVLLVVILLALAAVPVAADPDHDEHDPEQPPDATPSIESYDDMRRIIGDEIVDTPLEMHKLHDQQHGTMEGHLLPTQENVELVGQVDIEGATADRVADVAAFGNYAYLGVRDPEGCFDAGVAIIDISDPTSPQQVGFIDATEGSYPGEGVQILDMKTKFFRGQVLVFNNEICAPGQGEGGVSLWDVTDPLNPVVLTAHTGDDDPGGFFSRFNMIHSAFAWQDGKRAFVVLVDNEEFLDVDILEITDPRNPVMIAETGLPDWPDAQDEQSEGMGTGPISLFHDVQVKKVRGQMTMLLSYWDAGWILLNVDDPANPQFIDDSTYPDPDTLTEVSPPEGNAHQAEFSHNNQFIIGTDEDFSPFRVRFEITSGPNADEYPAGEFNWTVPIASLPDQAMNGPTVYGGYGCPDDTDQIPPPPTGLAPGEEAILVLQRGPQEDPNHDQHDPCFFSEKVEAAQNAGYGGVIIANHHLGAGAGDFPDALLCGAPGHEFTPLIPAICIGHRAFHLLFNTTPDYTVPYPDDDSPEYTEPAIGAVGEEVSATALFDGWGYVRLLDAQTLEQIDAYAIDEALDPRFAFRFGDLSVHEVATDPNQNLAYLSYYAGGLRVIKFGEDGIQEVGSYIAEGGNDFWGVEVHRLPTGVHEKDVSGGRGKETLILASDRDSGLWIFRYTGE